MVMNQAHVGVSVGPALSDQEFRQALEPLNPGFRVAVAVSGGADSMALLLLTQKWARQSGAQLLALTVDHALRPDSASEAQQVAEWCGALGITHRILQWSGVKPKGDIQAAARRARYALMSAECVRSGVPVLLLAHHLQDQAETFLLRLGRGSGVDGLAAMAAESARNGMRLLRPLLAFPKARLLSTLLAEGQIWINDPSNSDVRFARPCVRALLAPLDSVGLTAQRLAATAQRMARARAALDQATDALLRSAIRLEPSGFCVLSREKIIAAPAEIGLRALSRVLMTVGAQEYPPRLARLERLYDWLVRGAAGGGRTLSGCCIVPGKVGVSGIIVVREPAAMGPELLLKPGEERLWDGRFRVILAAQSNADNADMDRYFVRAVGDAGLRQVRQERLSGLQPRLIFPPRMACLTTPGLWLGESLIAAPLLGFPLDARPLACGFTATFSPIRQLLPSEALARP